MKKLRLAAFILALTAAAALSSCGGGDAASSSSGTKTVSGKSDVSSVEPGDASEVQSDAESAGSGTSTPESGASDATSSKPRTSSSSSTKPGDKPTSSIPPVDVSVYPKSLKGKTATRLLWYAPDKNEKLLYDNFTKVTGCKVSIVQTTYANYLSKLSGMLSAGAAPDSVYLNPRHYPMFITKSLIQDIEKYVNKSDPVLDFKGMDILKFDGKYYGISNEGTAESMVLYFNKTMFDNATGVNKNPLELYNEGKWDWNALKDLTKKMQQKDDKGNIVRQGLALDSVNMVQISTGVDFVTVNGKTLVNSLKDERIAKSWAFVRELLANGGEKTQSPLSTRFANGRAAMVIEGSWGINRTGENAPLKSMKDKWDWVPYPKYPDGKSYQPVIQQVWCVPARAKNPEAGYYLNRWCLDPSSLEGVEGAPKPDQYITAADKVRLKEMYALDKFSMLSQGIIGDTDYWSLWLPLGNLDGQNTPIQTAIDTWYPKINSAITRTMNEFPK